MDFAFNQEQEELRAAVSYTQKNLLQFFKKK